MKRAGGLLVLALVVVILGACQMVQPYKGKAGGKRVAVVGDSITAYASTQVNAELAKDYMRSVNATPGIDLPTARTQLVVPAVATKPDVLVIELGINSAHDGWNSADLTRLERIMADAGAIPCVVWVTPTALAPSYYDHLGPGTAKERIEAMKASVAKRVAKRPNFHLADWGAIEGQHPEWFKDDHLHNTDAGEAAYAAYLREQVGALCG